MENKRKSIGLVTICSDNYGSLLQAFALHNKICEMGYDLLLIRYVPYSQGGGINRSYSKLYKFIHIPICSIWQYIANYRMIHGRKEAFKRFRDRQFKFTTKLYSKLTDKSDLNSQFDTFVCGSDMMWCEDFHEDWEYYFLRFTHKEKRISYAPSFGNNQISDANINRCKRYLKGFPIESLSCREISGVRMIRDKFGLEAHYVVDPTMLFKKEEWNDLVDDSRILKNKYVLLYLFGGQDGYKKILDQVEKWGIGELKSLSINGRERIQQSNIGPFEFVRLFRDAEFIVTDTFHGVMFSLIYEKPFVCLTRESGQHWAKFSDRMIAQLEILGISERYHDSSKLLPDYFKSLDYTGISNKIKESRENSLAYLKNAIESSLQDK